MTQVRQFWAGVTNYVNGRENRDLFLTSSQIGAEKMGHSLATHGNKYASQRVGFDECHFEAYHFAIGDISYNILKNKTRSMLSLGDIRQAMRLRYPNSDSARGQYLSLQQKELVEFGYGPGSSTDEHCLGLLAPGDGKSETYLIPTIARRLANKGSKMIIHVSPYSFLARYQFSNACSAINKLHLDGIVILTFNGRDIQEGKLPEQLRGVESLPNLLFLNLDAIHHLFNNFHEDLKSWTAFIDKIVIDEVHTCFSEVNFREKYKVYHQLPSLGIPICALSGSVPLFAVSRLAKRLCLSVSEDLSDMKIIHGGDIIGNFPSGFKIRILRRRCCF
jgi:hypothetical protein